MFSGLCVAHKDIDVLMFSHCVPYPLSEACRKQLKVLAGNLAKWMAEAKEAGRV